MSTPTVNAYGDTAITWSTGTAEHPFAGSCESWDEDEKLSEHEAMGEVDLDAIMQFGKTIEFRYEASIRAASTDFLDLSSGGGIAISKWTTGSPIILSCEEFWEEEKEKIARCSGTYFPYMASAGNPMASRMTAFTPAGQSVTGLRPAGRLIWSTIGMTHSSGKIVSLNLSQSLKVTNQEKDPIGKIIGAVVTGYRRKISLELTSRADAPVTDTILVVSGAPSHAGGFAVQSCKTTWKKGDKKRYSIEAIWAPCFGS